MTDTRATEVAKTHQRLDDAEEAILRARYLSDALSAEYAEAGHAYFAALQRADFGSAGRVHGEHYDTCRPKIRARVEAELVADGVITVTEHRGQSTWHYVDLDRCCLRCGKDLTDEGGVYIYVEGHSAPDHTVRGGSGPQVLLCIKHGSGNDNNISRKEFERLYRERYGTEAPRAV